MYRVLVSDKLGQPGLDILESADDTEFDVKPGLSEGEIIAIIDQYDALIVRSGTQVTREIIESGTRLKVIGRAGVGVDNVDVMAATRLGVIVMNTPKGNTIATAEHTMALLLAASRHVAAAHQSMLEGRWDRSSFSGQELNGKTLGVVGFGRVGRIVAARAQAFGMDVLGYDPYVSEVVAKDTGISLVDLHDLLAGSDYVTLHTALSPETEHLINADTLGLMKRGAVLVNAARGGLIDSHAVAAALDSGQLRSVAIDVFDQEPPSPQDPLVGHPRVVHTPHLAASTEEAQRDIAIQVVEQVLAAIRGKHMTNSVNLAFPGEAEYAEVLPFVELGEKLGRLQAVMAPSGIRAIEVEVHADNAEALIRPVAAGILKGVLAGVLAGHINYVNAPLLAEEQGIKISRSVSIGDADYKNQVSCRVIWDGGDRTVAGAVFGRNLPRIVQISGYRLEADPTGVVLLMLNHDVPGVIGQVGTVLGSFGINIAEWRLGRDKDRHEAMSFINLDNEPGPEVLASLRGMAAVTKAEVVRL